MRLFYAISASGASAELMRLQKLLLMRSRGAKPVPAENMHVTLRFIGESDRIGELALALKNSVRAIRPFELRLDRFASFDRGRSSVAICRVNGDLSELNAMHESLEASLFDAGFAREGRPLAPHITLAREVELTPEDRAFLEGVSLNAAFSADRVSLFRSTRERGRMVYTPIHTEML